jgi:CsbD-like.
MQDKMKGEGNEIKGKVKEEAGKLGGDRSTEISGKIDQVKGELQEKVGDAKLKK